MWKNSDWVKLAFFGFCIALSYFILQYLFGPHIGRYQPLSQGDKASDAFYIDTATGEVFHLSGKLISQPGGKRK